MNKLTARFLALAITLSVLPACAISPTSISNGYGVPIMYRTIPERISDEAIENTAYQNLPNIAGISQNSVRVGIDSFRREVLLTGEVPSEQIKQDIEAMVQSIYDVNKVLNHLTVTPVAKSQSHTVHENYIKSKILAKVMAKGPIRPSQFKIVVRSNKVYLMGFLTAAQEQQILSAMEGIQGIELVQLLNVRVDGSGEALAMAAAGTSVDDPNAQTAGLVYGGSAAVANNLNTNSNVNSAAAAGMNPAVNRMVPIIRMEGNPTSSYVNLYNGTDKP